MQSQACDNNGEIKIKVYSSTQEALDKYLFLKKKGNVLENFLLIKSLLSLRYRTTVLEFLQKFYQNI